jgi:hypothetical protein
MSGAAKRLSIRGSPIRLGLNTARRDADEPSAGTGLWDD